ncbi:hypothetical protein BH23ACT9_BH23ACT9_28030 [soil metagenome]
MQLAGLTDLGEVGRGGFGVVRRAFQPALQRVVAVKILSVDPLDGAGRQRFEREARALGVLGGHPHIVTVHDVGFTGDGVPYVVMPFLTGGSIGDRLRAGGRIGGPETLDIGVKLCGALETAHRRGVVHGDVKPDNVMLDEYDEPQLCDFGIAELLDGPDPGAAAAPATPAFAAPEVMAGQRPTVALTSTRFRSRSSRCCWDTCPQPQRGDDGRRLRRSLTPSTSSRTSAAPCCGACGRTRARGPDRPRRWAAP